MQSDYIRREDASNWLKQYGQDVLHGKYKFSLMYIWKNIMDLPAADVAPVRHGKWFSDVFCSECGWVNEVEPGFIGDTKGFNFCPNCGAKMDR